MADQNFMIVWLNSNVDESNDFYQNTLTRLQQIADQTRVFTDVDKCIDFITDVVDEKIFLVISTNAQLVAFIHNIAQIYHIYLHSDETVEQLGLHEFPKVKKVSNSIEFICELLRQDIRQSGYDDNPISIVSRDQCSTRNLRELPPSFINDMENLIHFWYEKYCDNERQLKIINKFEKEYRSDLAIWWYSKENFVYSILNAALRTLNADVLIKMGFFLRDLHQQIKQLHNEQATNRVKETVYRGQGMHTNEFEKLRNSPGGLLSFNNFLSTSTDLDVSKMYCPNLRLNPDTIPVLFAIEIDSLSRSTPFTVLNDRSNFSTEKEVLFSIHSVFRIGELIYNEEEGFWQVQLTLTNDNDEELIELTKYIRNEIQGGTGWHRLGQLLIQIGDWNKAEEIFQILIQRTSPYDIITLVRLYNQLGVIKHYQGDLQAASRYYNQKQTLESQYNIASQSDQAVNYNNIGSINLNRGDYQTARRFFEKALDIELKCLSSDNPDLAITYNNIAMTYKYEGNYEKALESYREALECQRSLPANHGDLARSYNNIAVVNYELSNYAEAVNFYEKALRIELKSLAPDHMNIATTYCSLGAGHKKLGDYPKAMKCYEKTLEFYKNTLPADHPNYAVVYSNIGSLHVTNQEYSQALEFYNKALEIEEKPGHVSPSQLAISYNNIAALHHQQENFHDALEFYQKARGLLQANLPPNHKDIGIVHNNIGVAYYQLGQNFLALSFCKKALEIYQTTLPDSHERVQECRNNIENIQNQ